MSWYPSTPLALRLLVLAVALIAVLVWAKWRRPVPSEPDVAVAARPYAAHFTGPADAEHDPIAARFAERRRWEVEVLNESLGEHGGYKEIIARIIGEGAYSRLKFESGAHRVQRVPETESQGRVHTSAATVAIMPEPDEIEQIEINPADLRIDVYRASGAGGQHVNRTESAVRITHLPSNIVVQCQNDRSQHKNKAQAMNQLKAKLYELELQERRAAAAVVEEGKADVGWGSQIRNYVLDQSRIKDLRTGVETGNTQAVLDGGLDNFIEASLKQGL